MTDTDFDDIELSIHEEAWRKVERILDQRRHKLTLYVTIDGDRQVTVQLPPDIAPGEYAVTLLVEAAELD